MDISPENSNANYPVVLPLGKSQVVIAWSERNRIYYTIKNSADIDQPAKLHTVQYAAIKKDLSHVKTAIDKDPVCGMALGKSPSDTVMFKNKIYGFCSDVCKNRFLSDPQKTKYNQKH